MTDKQYIYPNLPVLLIVSVAYFLVLLLLGSDRSLVPIDETRYVSVAWDMWLHGDYLVPHLNGQPYPHKPPLLFWLINLSWSLFGVSQWAALLVPATSGIIGIWLTIPISRLLWQEAHPTGLPATWLLATSLFWMVWSTIVAFDLLVAICAEVALLGILLSWRGKPVPGWSLTGLGIGLGILAKGPVILVFVLPVALLAPVWMKQQRPASWWRWYGGLVYAVVLGAAIGLTWAIPAAISGGEEYRDAILWKQTAGRVVNSFAHARPFWWYLPVLPVLLFPWILWSPLWRALRTRRNAGFDSGERLVFLLTGSALLIFSLISGKQIHYLVPLFPPLMLLAGHLLGAVSETRPKLADILFVSVPALILGLVITAVPYLPLPVKYAWINSLSPLWGLPVIAGTLLLIPARKLSGNVLGYAAWPGLVSLMLFSTVQAGIVKQVAGHYDITRISQLVAGKMDSGYPVAFVGDTYNGEFNFIARLDKAVTNLRPADRQHWIDSHPNGLIIERLNKAPDKDVKSVLDVTPYKRTFLVLHDVRLPVEKYQ
jgi:4-amino-4-deoxy-L-arabinose transferase-like glycosyltransferase